MGKDSSVVAAIAIGFISFLGWAYLEGNQADRQAEQNQILRQQNEQLLRENTEITGRYLELQKEHEGFKDGVVYGGR